MTGQSSVYSQIDDHGEPGNMNNVETVSCRILQNGPRNLAKFAWKTVGPIIIISSSSRIEQSHDFKKQQMYINHVT